MQSIQLPDEQFQRLTDVVQAAGYDDLQSFLDVLSDEPTHDPRGQLTKDQLAASVEMIRRSEADLAAGRYRDMRQAMQEIADKHGLTVQ